MVHRYLDLYRAARLLVAIGKIVKVIGIFVGIAVFLPSVLASLTGSPQPLTFTLESTQSHSFSFGTLAVGAVMGIGIGGLIFLLGTLISAQGQIILTLADAAIHTSPFMTEDEKAQAMSVPFRRRTADQVGPERR